jgi:hypothetical protein
MTKMKQSKLSIILFFFVLFFNSCAKIFYTDDAVQLAHNEKIIAIIPPTVSIAAQRKVDAESIKEQQKTESVNIQKAMYAWMLKRRMQGKFNSEVMDIETTNAKLKQAGYPDNLVSPDELCKTLGVDGIITSNYSMSKPMSDGGAVALGLLVGAWGATNEVHVSMSIHDTKTNKLIWNFDHQFSGSIGSSSDQLINNLMRKASRKMPYMNE